MEDVRRLGRRLHVWVQIIDVESQRESKSSFLVLISHKEHLCSPIVSKFKLDTSSYQQLSMLPG